MAKLVGIFSLFAAFGLALASDGQNDTKKDKKDKTLDVDVLFKKLDTNGDGKLSKSEFLKMADKAKDQEKAKTFLERVYDKLDPEMKGLTKAQFHRVIMEMRDKKKKDANGHS